MTIASKIGAYLVKNAPTILTGIGVAGVLSTAFLAAKAAVQADQLIKSEFGDEKLPLKQVVKLTWRLYIPSIAVGALTVSCIISANSLNIKRNLALAGLYSVAERALTEYQDEVIEELGEFKERRVRDKVAQKTVDENPVSKNSIIVTGAGDTLCYETFTGRYFRSDMEKIRKAVNSFNESLLQNDYLSLNNFFEFIDVPPSELGYEVGWRSEQLLDLIYSAVLDENGQPCIAISYQNKPHLGYTNLR